MLNNISSCQGGGDSGRHNWYGWEFGPEPEGKKTTLAINLFDLSLVEVINATEGTPDFCWREPNPNSEFCTRVLGMSMSRHSRSRSRKKAGACVYLWVIAEVGTKEVKTGVE